MIFKKDSQLIALLKRKSFVLFKALWLLQNISKMQSPASSLTVTEAEKTWRYDSNEVRSLLYDTNDMHIFFIFFMITLHT